MAHNVPASRVLDGLPRGLLARWPSAGVEREDEWEPDLPDDLPNDLPDSPDVLGSPDESPTRSVRVGWVVSATERGQERGVRIDASAGVLAAEHSAEELSSDVGTPESPPVKPGWGRSLLEGRSLEKAAAEEDAMGDAAASSSFRRRRLLAVSRRVRSAAAAKQEGNVHADAHHDVTLSKHLSQLLRHKALEHGIQIDANGWALVSDALRWSNSMETNACMLRGEDATNVRAWSQYDVREMVGLNATFGVHRFVLREAQVGLQIRAVAKHTMRLPGVCRSCCRQASAAEVGGGLEVAAPSRVSTGAPEATGSFKNGSLAGSFKVRRPGSFIRRPSVEAEATDDGEDWEARADAAAAASGRKKFQSATRKLSAAAALGAARRPAAAATDPRSDTLASGKARADASASIVAEHLPDLPGMCSPGRALEMAYEMAAPSNVPSSCWMAAAAAEEDAMGDAAAPVSSSFRRRRLLAVSRRVSTGVSEAAGSFKNRSPGSFKSGSPGSFKNRSPGSSKSGSLAGSFKVRRPGSFIRRPSVEAEATDDGEDWEARADAAAAASGRKKFQSATRKLSAAAALGAARRPAAAATDDEEDWEACADAADAASGETIRSMRVTPVLREPMAGERLGVRQSVLPKATKLPPPAVRDGSPNLCA